ncbi:MAG TPA: GAF domain-containing protein [Polyangiaceae bacterium]|nr:GAF domain-containing protein [Polyangiaceae bacterium]
MLLADRTVLLVDPDTSALDSLSVELRAHGAKCFSARDAATAIWGARETLPDAVVCELELPDRDATALLFELRNGPVSLPAVALAAERRALVRLRENGHTLGNRFEKRFAKPARALDVVDAICSLLGDGSEGGLAPSLDVIADALDRHDYRSLLGRLNATTSHRYSALFRFDEGALTSVWTFDRKEPKVDPFPLDVPVTSTPLAALLERSQAVCISDTAADERVTREQRHADMRGFAAVPLHGVDNAVFGAICHFDPEPQATDAASLDLLERTAKIFCFNKRRARPR